MFFLKFSIELVLSKYMTVQRLRGISGRIMKRGNLLRKKQNVWLVLIMKENKTCIGHLCVSDFSIGETSPRERDFRERQRQTETETETETDRDRQRQTETDDNDDDDETLFKHGIYISKNTALQKSREIIIKILKLNLSI